MVTAQSGDLRKAVHVTFCRQKSARLLPPAIFRQRIPNVLQGNTLEVQCAVERFGLLSLRPPYDWVAKCLATESSLMPNALGNPGRRGFGRRAWIASNAGVGDLVCRGTPAARNDPTVGQHRRFFCAGQRSKKLLLKWIGRALKQKRIGSPKRNGPVRWSLANSFFGVDENYPGEGSSEEPSAGGSVTQAAGKDIFPTRRLGFEVGWSTLGR
jgi:hypothetical protein